MSMQPPPADPSPPDAPSPKSDPPRIVDSADLLGSGREILIRHGQEIYRLRRTRHDRLILHK